MTKEEAARDAARAFVRVVFAGWGDEDLGELVEVGKQYPAGPEVNAMNEALHEELERRKGERDGKCSEQEQTPRQA